MKSGNRTNRPGVTKTISKRNSAFQRLEALKLSRAKRAKAGEVFIEGVIPITLCHSSGLEATQIFFRDSTKLSPWAQQILEYYPRAERFVLSTDLMAEVSDRENASELIVVARMPVIDVDQSLLDRVLVLDRPSSPGNFGSIVRSCDAFGIQAVFTFGRSVDPFDPRSIAASRGTVFGVPIIKLGSRSAFSSLLTECRSRPGLQVLGSSATRGHSMKSLVTPQRFALIIGNEATGMSSFLESMVDDVVTIPMAGEATSLNISSAASILLYELT